MTERDNPQPFSIDVSTDAPQRSFAARKLDLPRRLSESVLWRMEESYYERSGVDAWSSGDVPFAMTNSPALARTYVQLISGLVEDCLAGRMGAFDPDEPIYVLDLGAGAGRLGYYCLEALRGAALDPVKVVYVLTDRVDRNLTFWASHPKLRPFFESGHADAARYDVAEGGALHLVHSGADLVPGQVANPVVAIANYLFDVIPQDLFCSTPHGLEEELVEIFSDEEELEDSADLYEHLYFAAHHVPVPDDRYGERATAVLRAVVAERPKLNERFLFPIASIGVFDQLLDLSTNRLVFLVAERDDAPLLPGSVTPPAAAAAGDVPATRADTPVRGATAPGAPAAPPGEASHAYHPTVFFRLGSHGASFSLPVDLGIMTLAARQSGGDVLRGHDTAHRLAVSAIVVGDAGAASSIRSRYENSVLELAPDDLCTTAMAAIAAVALSKEHDESTLEILLAALRLAGYDAIPFAKGFKAIAACLPPPPGLRPEVLRVLEQISALNFWIHPEGDTAYAVATLVGRCGEFERALELLEEARVTFGARPLGHFNAAMCYLGLDRVPEGLAELEACLALDPTNEPARQLRDRIRSGDVSPPSAPAN